jgi:hypothetical protein
MIWSASIILSIKLFHIGSEVETDKVFRVQLSKK